MKPHQYYLMAAASIFGYYAVNFLIFYLESHYKVIRIDRIETKDEQVHPIKWDDKVFYGQRADSLPTKHTYLTTPPIQREPIAGYKSLYELEKETGYHNIAIGYEVGYSKNQ